MSLDIMLTNRETGETVADMNWLRNPFGLCNWAEDNYLYATKAQHDPSLWYVINHWAYDRSDEVDRSLFRSVVNAYADVLNALDRAYFWFDAPALMRFVAPHMHTLPTETMRHDEPRVVGIVVHERRVGIPIEHFACPVFGLSGDVSLAGWLNWFAQLVAFADLLQDPVNQFSCSN